MMIAERETGRKRERGGGSSFLYVSDCSVQTFLRYFSQKDVLNWNDWSSLNCSDVKEMILFLPQIEILDSYSLDPGLQTAECDSFFLFFNVEPTRITVPPLSLDVTTGQSLVLPCEVSSDSSLNPKFKWFFNGKAIDFSRQEHFEMIGKVSVTSLETQHMKTGVTSSGATVPLSLKVGSFSI